MLVQVIVTILLALSGPNTAYFGTYVASYGPHRVSQPRPRCCNGAIPAALHLGPDNYGAIGPKRWQAPLRQAAYHSLARHRTFSGGSLDERLESDSALWEQIREARFMRRSPEDDEIELRTGVLVYQEKRNTGALEFRTSDHAIYNCPGRWCRPADDSLLALWRVRQTKDGLNGLWIRVKLMNGPGQAAEEDVYQFTPLTGLRQIHPQPTLAGLELKQNGAQYVWKAHLSSEIGSKEPLKTFDERPNLNDRIDTAVQIPDKGLRNYQIFGLRSAILTDDLSRQNRPKYYPEIVKGDKGIYISTRPDGYNHVVHRVTKTGKHKNRYVEFEPGKRYSGFLPLAKPAQSMPQQVMLYSTNRPVYNNGRVKKRKEYKPGFITIFSDKRNSDVRSKLESQDFKPSTPFMQYSERDPLYHLEEELLPTPPIITADLRYNSQPQFHQDTSQYPDSINAQLPPPGKSTDTRVPYVLAEVINAALIHQPGNYMDKQMPNVSKKVNDPALVDQSWRKQTKIPYKSAKVTEPELKYQLGKPTEMSYTTAEITDSTLSLQSGKQTQVPDLSTEITDPALLYQSGMHTQMPYTSAEVTNPTSIHQTGNYAQMHYTSAEGTDPTSLLQSGKQNRVPYKSAEVIDLALIHQSEKHIQMHYASAEVTDPAILILSGKQKKEPYILTEVSNPAFIHGNVTDPTVHTMSKDVTDSAIIRWVDRDFGKKMGSIAILETSPPNLSAGASEVLNSEITSASVAQFEIPSETTSIIPLATLTTTKALPEKTHIPESVITEEIEFSTQTVPIKHMTDDWTVMASGLVEDDSLLSKDRASTMSLPTNLWTAQTETTELQHTELTEKELTNTETPEFSSMSTQDFSSTLTVEDHRKLEESESTIESAKTTNINPFTSPTSSENGTEQYDDTTMFPSTLDEDMTEHTQRYPYSSTNSMPLTTADYSYVTENATTKQPTPEEVVIALTNQAFQQAAILPNKSAENRGRAEDDSDLTPGATHNLFDYVRRAKRLGHSLVVNRVSHSVSYKTSKGETGELSTNQIQGRRSYGTPLSLTQQLDNDLIDLTMAE